MIQTVKFLIIGDIHLGESRPSTTHPGVVRQANSEAERTLRNLIPFFNDQDFDLVVQIGDVIRDTFEKPVDTKNYQTGIEIFRQLSHPTIHLLGNHDILALTDKEIAEICDTHSNPPEFLGTKELENLRIIWLDVKLDGEKKAWLTKEGKSMLSSLPTDDKLNLIFSHYALSAPDEKDTFYFHKDRWAMHYHDTDFITEFLEDHRCLNINAHLHILSHQIKQNNHFITVPAFTENFAAEKFPQNNPGVYSILEISENEFIFTSYSGQFAFSKIQGEI